MFLPHWISICRKYGLITISLSTQLKVDGLYMIGVYDPSPKHFYFYTNYI